MATLKIKYLRGAITVFALCLIGTVSAAPNGNGDEERKEVKAEKIIVNETWSFNGGSSDSPTDASKYTRTSGEPCDGEPETICQISAPANPLDSNQPHMSAPVQPEDPNLPATTVQQQITDALASSASNETVQSFREF